MIRCVSWLIVTMLWLCAGCSSTPATSPATETRLPQKPGTTPPSTPDMKSTTPVKPAPADPSAETTPPPVPTPPPPIPTPPVAESDLEKEVKQLVAELGADEYERRERAEKALRAFGAKIMPILMAMPKPTDAEIRMRLQKLMDTHPWLEVDIKTFKLTDVELKDFPGALGNKAVLFGKGSSAAAGTITIAKEGRYEFRVRMSAPDSEHDAFRMLVTGDGVTMEPPRRAEQDPATNATAARLFPDWEASGEGQEAGRLRQTVPQLIRLEKAGKIEVKFSATDETGYMLDRIEIKPASGQTPENTNE